jgi:hypothetical protein
MSTIQEIEQGKLAPSEVPKLDKEAISFKVDEATDGDHSKVRS